MGCIEMLQMHAQEECTGGLIETWDVLKFFSGVMACIWLLINRNMGCIEIA